MTRKKSPSQKANSGSTRIAENKHETLQDEIINNPINNLDIKYPLSLITTAKSKAKQAHYEKARAYFDEIINEFKSPVIYLDVDRHIVAELAIWKVTFDNCSEATMINPVDKVKNGNTGEFQTKMNEALNAASIAQRKINELRKQLGLTPNSRVEMLLKGSTIKSQDIITNQTNESNNTGYDFDAMAGKHKYIPPNERIRKVN